MKMSRRQAKMIEEMVRDEAERLVKGRRLAAREPLNEAGPDPYRVSSSMMSDTVDARGLADRLATEWMGKVDQKAMPMIAKELSRFNVGGLSTGVMKGDLDELRDMYNDQFLEIETELHANLSEAIREYIETVSDLITYLIEEENAL